MYNDNYYYSETQIVWVTKLYHIINAFSKLGQVEQNFGQPTLTPLINWSTFG